MTQQPDRVTLTTTANPASEGATDEAMELDTGTPAAQPAASTSTGASSTDASDASDASDAPITLITDEPTTDAPTGATDADLPTDAPWASWDDAPSPNGADDADGAATGALPQQTSGASSLARAFSMRRTVVFGVTPFVALALTYLLETLGFHGDWAAGALAAGLAAFALAALTLVIWQTRLALGRRARVTTLLALALIAALIGVGVGGVVAIQPLHTAQAHQLEGAGQWDAAIHEYALAGERAPDAPDIARAYVEWGEQSLQRHQYALAAPRLANVVASYTQSGASVARARDALYQTYSEWMQSGALSAPYLAIITYFKVYQPSAACDSACHAAAPALDAQAYYLYGQQLAAQVQYNAAINAFEIAQSAYPHTPYAARAHTAAATAYLAYGKQLLVTACANALPVYQTLVKSYADTPEGHTAQQALATPQPVTGVIQGFPTNPLPTVYLSKGINLNIFYFSDEYNATINAATGAFSFSAVAQGAYNLSTEQLLANGADYRVFKDTTSGNVYSVQVGPLCSTNLGTLSYAVS